MCLGIPGRVVEILQGYAGQLALVDVLGAQRPINLGMLADPHLSPGDWILIHMGFALEQIDEAGAQKALSGLQMMGSAGDAERQADAEHSAAPAVDAPVEDGPAVDAPVEDGPAVDAVAGERGASCA